MYRDIKPDNIMITKDKIVKLIDFGLCKREDHGETLCGSNGYIAPEVVFNEERTYDRRVDIWSVGSMLYTSLFGYCPFLLNQHMMSNFSRMQLENALYLPYDLLQECEVDSVLLEIIEKSVVADPNKRATPQQLKEMLQ